MSQSRKGSLLEAVVNVAVGFGISLGAQLVLFPWFGIHVDARMNIQIGGCFTAVSIVRAYVLRRLFNHSCRNSNRASVAIKPLQAISRINDHQEKSKWTKNY